VSAVVAELRILPGHGNGVGPPGPPDGPRDAAGGPQENNTDLGNARRLLALHGHDLRYVPQWGTWLAWDGRRWKIDIDGEAHRRAKHTVRWIYEQALPLESEARKRQMAWALKSESARAIEDMLRQARTEPGVPVEPRQLDARPWLLNCLNGTLDLQTGELAPHARGHMLTKLAPVEYSPDAEAPIWQSFLERVTASNAELIDYLQRTAGYTLTGDVGEQALFFLYGGGSNGKSTYWGTLMALLGDDYATKAASSLLIQGRHDEHPTGLADLFGVRLAVASEVDEGRRLAEALVKDLTGGDAVKARRMHKDFFQFRPTHKLYIAANHKPVVKGTDDAMWRRIRLIPFEVTIPAEERDGALPAKLLEELPGILAWAVRGCLEWQRQGLAAPDAVSTASAAYRDDMDLVGAFIDDRCVREGWAMATATELYAAYKDWCVENGERELPQKVFGGRLTDRGYSRTRNTHSKRWEWSGIALATLATHRDPVSGNSTDAGAGTEITDQGSQGSRRVADPVQGSLAAVVPTSGFEVGKDGWSLAPRGQIAGTCARCGDPCASIDPEGVPRHPGCGEGGEI
jgi:putative DNA primase/helicase